MGKKKGKKGSKKGKKGSKKGSKKGDSGPPPPPNHNGFNPDGHPIAVWTVDREAVLPDTPENEALRAERGTDPRTQPSRMIRIGEMQMSPVSDMKRRIHEVTNIPMARMHLLFRASEKEGGRPVQELIGYNESWPWSSDLTLVLLDDSLPLSAYGILTKSKERKEFEEKEKQAFEQRLKDDPEFAAQYRNKKLMEKEAAEAAKAKGKGKKKKSGKKKGGGSKKGKKGPKLSEKEQAALEAKEAKRKAEQEEALRIERDKARRWQENQVYMILKPDGMSNQPAFRPQPLQPVEAITPRNFLVRLPTPGPRNNSKHLPEIRGQYRPADVVVTT